MRTEIQRQHEIGKAKTALAYLHSAADFLLHNDAETYKGVFASIEAAAEELDRVIDEDESQEAKPHDRYRVIVTMPGHLPATFPETFPTKEEAETFSGLMMMEPGYEGGNFQIIKEVDA